MELEVFVQPGCERCERAQHLAREVDAEYPRLTVRVVDVSETPSRPADVFAVPTFLLNGRLFSLGNPAPSHLYEGIEALLRDSGGID